MAMEENRFAKKEVRELAGFEVSTGHIVPEGVQAATTLVGGRAEDGVTRARAMCEPGFLLCSVAVTALSRAGSGPKVLKQKP